MGRNFGSSQNSSPPRPLIEVQVSLGGQNRTLSALVDSGADMSAIPTAIAEAMTGLPFDQIGDDAGGVTGAGGSDIPSRIVSAELRYQGRLFAQRVLVTTVGSLVVGTSDFMRVFDVRFYWSHNPPEFHIEPAQPAKPRSKVAPLNPTVRPKRRKH